MKILQISPVAPPQRSGMANAAGEIYKATKETGVDVELVAAFGDSTIPGLKHWRIPSAGFLAFTPAIFKLLSNGRAPASPEKIAAAPQENAQTVFLGREKLFKKGSPKIGNFDIVHLHYPCYGNALMVSLSRDLGGKQPLVVSYHMDTVGRGLRRPVFWFHKKFLAPHFLRQAAAIVVASRDYAEYSLLAKYPELMDKVVEIPFGVDTTRFHAAAGKVVTAKNILFVSALDEQHYFKGLSVLLKAMVHVSGAALTVVGGGKLLEHYRKEAIDLQIIDRVNFAGRVSDDELPGYYQRADLFCSASLDKSEAYGMVLMEAAASGLPAVATDIPGVRSVVKNNETGLLVKPNDPSALAAALNSILNNPQLATRLAVAARAFALTRTWKSAGEKYLEVYQKVLSQPAP